MRNKIVITIIINMIICGCSNSSKNTQLGPCDDEFIVDSDTTVVVGDTTNSDIDDPEFEDEFSGDIDNDGILTVNDLIIMANYILDGTPTAEELELADSNGNGEIDILDIIYVVQLILGDSSFDNAVEWLEINIPWLDTKSELKKLSMKKIQ